MRSSNTYVLTCFWSISILSMIFGQILGIKSYNWPESRVKRQFFVGKQCVSNEGRAGTCQMGPCPNLGNKKPVICNSIIFQTKCCPNSNRGAVLPPNPSKACGVRPVDSNYLIVGGTESLPNSWPWAVTIHQITYDGNAETKSKFICGGSIINERYVLTAAHCIIRRIETLRARNFKIKIGAHDLKSSGFFADVSEIKVHEGYHSTLHINDIALFKLSEPINFNEHKNVAPVCLPRPDMEKNNLVGTISTLVGWGTTSQGGKPSPALQEVKVPIISTDECAQKYSSLLSIADQISEKQLCAGFPQGGKDSCQGDSGGSLTVPYNNVYYQLGIVSFGKGCAQPGYPGVYTRVTSYLNWLGAHMED